MKSPVNTLIYKPNYYAFGMVMPGRNGSGDYRYGFNNHEKVDEIAGANNHMNAEFWEYDPRLGRRWEMDPMVKPFESPYAVFGNNPIVIVDKLGLTGDVTLTEGANGQKGTATVNMQLNFYGSGTSQISEKQEQVLKELNASFNNGHGVEITVDGKKYDVVFKFELNFYEENYVEEGKTNRNSGEGFVQDQLFGQNGEDRVSLHRRNFIRVNFDNDVLSDAKVVSGTVWGGNAGIWLVKDFFKAGKLSTTIKHEIMHLFDLDDYMVFPLERSMDPTTTPPMSAPQDELDGLDSELRKVRKDEVQAIVSGLVFKTVNGVKTATIGTMTNTYFNAEGKATDQNGKEVKYGKR